MRPDPIQDESSFGRILETKLLQGSNQNSVDKHIGRPGPRSIPVGIPSSRPLSSPDPRTPSRGGSQAPNQGPPKWHSNRDHCLPVATESKKFNRCHCNPYGSARAGIKYYLSVSPLHLPDSRNCFGLSAYARNLKNQARADFMHQHDRAQSKTQTNRSVLTQIGVSRKILLALATACPIPLFSAGASHSRGLGALSTEQIADLHGAQRLRCSRRFR